MDKEKKRMIGPVLLVVLLCICGCLIRTFMLGLGPFESARTIAATDPGRALGMIAGMAAVAAVLGIVAAVIRIKTGKPPGSS